MNILSTLGLKDEGVLDGLKTLVKATKKERKARKDVKETIEVLVDVAKEIAGTEVGESILKFLAGFKKKSE